MDRRKLVHARRSFLSPLSFHVKLYPKRLGRLANDYPGVLNPSPSLYFIFPSILLFFDFVSQKVFSLLPSI